MDRVLEGVGDEQFFLNCFHGHLVKFDIVYFAENCWYAFDCFMSTYSTLSHLYLADCRQKLINDDSSHDFQISTSSK